MMRGANGDRKRCDKGKLVDDPDPAWIGSSRTRSVVEQERLREQAIPVADFQAKVTPSLVAFANTFGPGTQGDRSERWEDVRAAFREVQQNHTVTDDVLAPQASSDWHTAAEAVDTIVKNETGGFGSPVMPGTRDDLASWAYHFNLPEVWTAVEQIPLSFHGGTFFVGTEPGQVPPGNYRAESEHSLDGCYWATHDASGDIVANNFLSSGFSVVAHVSGSAHSVEFDSECGRFWQQ